MQFGNIIAYLMLLIWPLVTFVLFRRLTPDKALIWTILGGYLLLPPLAKIDLPAVPDLDKFSIPSLSALAMVLFVRQDRLAILPRSLLGKALVALFILGAFATVLTNTQPFALATGALPGMRIYDSVAAVPNQFIALLPLILGRRYLATPEAMRNLAVALVVAGLFYSVPMLIEVRLSPQINVWVYGFFQHDFIQMIRQGGFRPIVFLPHGLWAAFFALMCYVSALMLARCATGKERPRLIAATVYLGLLLVACKSVGPLAYGVVLTGIILLAGRRGMVLAAAAMAVLAISYPLLRGAHLVPIDALLAFAESISPERAQSLGFRFDNEEMLLNHANQQALFGWGGYGRNHVYDAVTAKLLTISDGAWIIAMGVSGWLGFIAQFGLLALPLFALAKQALRRGVEISPYVCLVALILGTNMVDLLPNATLIPFTWLLAGALLGHAEALALDRRQPAAPAVATAVAPARPPRTVL